MNAQLEPGDTVIWWKRIPGGDYVYPVKATVLGTTAKRVKIKAEDDGQTVVRFVKPENVTRPAGEAQAVGRRISVVIP